MAGPIFGLCDLSNHSWLLFGAPRNTVATKIYAIPGYWSPSNRNPAKSPNRTSGLLASRHIPWVSVPLIYWRICLKSFKWKFVGLCIYRHTWLTLNAIPGCVNAKYWSPPTKLLWNCGNKKKKRIIVWRRTKFGHHRSGMGLHPCIWAQLSNLEAYFSWLRKTPPSNH